jgi:hypothetical protein
VVRYIDTHSSWLPIPAVMLQESTRSP